MRDLVREVLRRFGVRRAGPGDELEEAWIAAVGPEAAAHTRLGAIRGGTLLVEVDSAPLLQELSAFRRRELIAHLGRAYRRENIVDIRFRQS